MLMISRLRDVARRLFQDSGRHTAFLVSGILIQVGVLLVLALPWIFWNTVTEWSIALDITVPLLVVALCVPALTRIQRSRFRARLGVDIPEPGPAASRPRLRETPGWLLSQTGRRQARYHLLEGPLIALGGLGALLLWGIAPAALSVFAWLWLVPLDWRLEHPGYTTWAAYVTVAGAAVLFAAVWLSGHLVRVDVSAATGLLGPSREEMLTRRVESLKESRASTVDAADAERRRIERDLHDGAQQRLVSLAVNLGLARATMNDLPEDARKVIEEAHREAKEAIGELNDLVRGLHPAVLEDRGLDAALSGIADRAPLPVRLNVALDSRPAATVEAVAYFVVSETLANVVKHAQASYADVAVERRDATLHVTVRDDGVGGADAARGSGLTGLAGRVASVDGTMSVDSPTGGPTVVTVELPCVP